MSTLEQQKVSFENIKIFCTNYKKDGGSRKTQEYLNKRLTTLSDLWEDFSHRHNVLEQELEEKTIEYFTGDIYGKTKAMYQSTKQDILNLLRSQSLEQGDKVEFNTTDIDEEYQHNDGKLRELLSKQECNFKALDRAMSKVDIDTISQKWELEDHLTILKSKWEPIDKHHWELDAILKGSNEHYYDLFVNIEHKYDELKRRLNGKIWSVAHYQHSAPRVQVPEFTGNYSQWVSFKDLFLETIHNNPTINKAQKMQHLKTKLRGEAERLVQHLTISAENYSSCWEILTQRYDNKRLQFTSYINTMLNLPVAHHPDAHSFKKMHDVILECLNGLANIGLEITTWDPMIVHLMSLKLDSSSFNDYLKELQNQRELPVLTEFLSFLENRFMAYETMKNQKKEAITSTSNYQKPSNFNKLTFNKPYQAKKSFTYKTELPKSYHTLYGNCTLCDGSHVLMQCPKFIDLDPVQRNITAARLQICKNCLYSHGNSECKSTKTCKECNMRHHTLLHNPMKKNMSTNYNKNNSSSQRPATLTARPTSNHLSNKETEILLTTVQLRVQAIDGTDVTLRALLDQGSQVNLLTENTAQLLKLPRNKLSATISGIGASSKDCKGRVQLKCKSMYSDYAFETQALVMSKITNNLPNATFERKNWPHLENLKLADPDYNLSRSVDLLLGADVYSKIILDGVLRGNPGSPLAQQTHLGWILCGKLQTFNCHITTLDLEEITKFWETEDIMQDSSDVPQEGHHCETHYKQTVQRASDGKYIVQMPFHPNYEEKLGSSKAIAISQFLQLEKRLQRKAKLAEMYKDFMKEYADLGHMKLSSSTTSPEYFLPHHGVLRDSSSTTKLRVVFNGSQNTTSGHSLNSVQFKGPNLQKDIQSLILKWRTYKYAYTADIAKMYRCIWIAEEQHSVQKIIWRNSPNEKLKEYSLCTVSYGTKSAPWLAIRTLKQLAMDDGHKYPAAANALLNEFYVDDLLSGHHSLQAAEELQTTLIELLKGGGMNLRKWSANHPALLQNLKEDQVSTTGIFDFKNEQATKTLGLSWNPGNDTFTFNWDLDSKKASILTKRVLLSEISRLYDPVGFWAPITITAKLLFQRVWLNQLSWDEELPKDLQDSWTRFKMELKEIKTLKLQRWVGTTENEIQLFGFSDASEKAYSCVIYNKTTNEQGEIVTTLVAAKTRVAPLASKKSLPKLELAGALLLSQLVKKIKEALTGFTVTIHAWCDSQVVLAWLQGDTSRWEKYVANRVTKITEIIPVTQWHYVKSEQNAADAASRGLYPNKLMNFQLWWHGPEFLKSFDSESQKKNPPTSFTTNICVTNETETRSSSKHNKYITNELLQKYSSFTRVTRVIAWILRFIAARNNKRSDTAYLTTSELAKANELIIKCAQRLNFEQEYKQLMKKQPTTKQSSLFKLNPYLDSKGIIRLGGRLNKSNLPLNMKNPIILPNKGRLTELIIDQAHAVTLHGGARVTLFYIRQRYWIIGGNRAVKTRLRQCVPCHRFKPTENYQLMADLPEQRVTPSKPFTHTGVDFTGAVEIKLNKGRGVKTSKGYVAIFVCMTTKAVHIELVSDLSTEAFLAAFQRLCSRRGVPKHMYSDCGTNFIGSARTLKNEYEGFQLLLPPEFFDEMGKQEMQWHFNAPAWPTAGGIWERAVRSMKHHLRRVLGDQKLTYEEFATLLTKIEACMNSRPLCPLTEDPEEFYNCLTPGHFLTGGPTLSLPLSDHSDEKTIDLRRRWQLLEHMHQQFWKSWANEYLSQLQTRSKWNKPTRNIKEGDVVLVKDNNLPPGKWAMGRVLETHPGSDGYVRVTTIKTKSGITKRPIVKLSPLPIETNYEDIKKPQKIDTEPNTKKPARQNKLAKRTLITLFTSLIIMCGFINESHAGNTTPAQITTLEPERPIYYDTMGQLQIIHDEWTLLMYYNLSNYWQAVDRIKNYLHGINNLCQMTDPRYCKTTLEQLYHETDLLNYYNSLLLAPHKHLTDRKKRGLINGVGYVANSLFGILDQRFADKYQNDIKAVKNNENYLLELIQNQTSIVELENTVLKKSEENIKRQFHVIDDFMNNTNANFAKVESTLEAVMATSYFNSASLAAYLLINNLRSVQEMLFNTLTDIYKGHIDVHLVTPVNLVKQLSAISGRLPRTLSLPVENIREDIKDLYKLLYVKARVTDSYFLFEIHIPLISDEDFTFYQAIPLPVKSTMGTAIIITTSKYIGVNFRKNIYVSLTEELFKQCIQQRPDIYICNKNLPVYNLNNNNVSCEAKLLGHHYTTPCDVINTSCKDEWIELHAINTWLAVCCNTCSLRTICENDVTAHTMTSSGIVTLPQGCVLQASHLTIHSHNQFNSKIQIDYNINVPVVNSSVNRIVNLTSYKISPTTFEHSEEAEIDRRLTGQYKHEQALPSNISSHDIHQYTISYLLLGIAITVFVVWAVKRRFLCMKRTSRSQCSLKPKKRHHEDIEMQTIPPTRTLREREPKPSMSQAERHHQDHASADNVAFEFD